MTTRGRRGWLGVAAATPPPCPDGTCAPAGWSLRYNSPVLREGPIPAVAHGAIEYVAGAAFIVAPFLLSYGSAAKFVSIVVGVVILVVAAATEGETSLVDQIPVTVHHVLDYILAGFMIAAPFIFGFSDETSPLAWFIAFGVTHLLITIGTRFISEQQSGGGARGSGGGEKAGGGAKGGGAKGGKAAKDS